MTRIVSLLPVLLAIISCIACISPASCHSGDDLDEHADATFGTTIPRLIIQTGPRDANRRDENWRSYQSSLKSLNPDFAYLFFDDDAALSFVDEYFADTDLPRIYRDAPRFVLKADLFRYAAIKILGGFYMDMDMMAKASFEPLVQDSQEHRAIFPKEWWRSDEAYSQIYGEGRVCTDDEDHWQVGNYAFAAAPNHPFITDALNEAMARTVRLIEITAEDETASISDNDILLSTGPYMLSELYHEGRRNGKYADVAHIRGDDDMPFRLRSYGGNDWHKFGRYAEHMLTHSWVTSSRRRLQDTYDMYGTYNTRAGDKIDYKCISACPGIDSIEDLYMLVEKEMDLYYGSELSVCIEACVDTYGSEYGAMDTYGAEYGVDGSKSGAVATISLSLVYFRTAVLLSLLLGVML